jgi:hypothetical protein
MVETAKEDVQAGKHMLSINKNPERTNQTPQ